MSDNNYVIQFTVDEETADDIIEDIEESMEEGEEMWEFRGDFPIEAAESIKENLEAQSVRHKFDSMR